MRYGFGYKALADSQHDEFLDEVFVACMIDAYEAALNTGEDIYGELFPCELAAARDKVDLPARSFERRKGQFEHELEEAIEDYREDEE